MQRHAYLILAHENTLVLKRLLMLLDRGKNDIFIHIDKNSKEFLVDDISAYVKKTKINISRKYRVYWGTNGIAFGRNCYGKWFVYTGSKK